MGIAVGLAVTAAGQQPPKAGAPQFKGAPPTATKAGTPPPAKPLPPKTASKGAKIPEPEDVTLRTRDGVDLKATYYAAATASGGSKKEVVPIIMVHGLDGQRGEFHRPLLWGVLALLLIESFLAWKFGHNSPRVRT